MWCDLLTGYAGMLMQRCSGIYGVAGMRLGWGTESLYLMDLAIQFWKPAAVIAYEDLIRKPDKPRQLTRGSIVIIKEINTKRKCEMPERRNLDRERLEVYFVYVLLAYRPIFRISGLLIVVYSIIVFSVSPIVGGVALGLAIFLVVPTFSFQATLYLAKFAAWTGTLFKNDG